jgi:hypothetical protein
LRTWAAVVRDEALRLLGATRPSSKSRVVGIEAGYADSIAEAARRADSIVAANAAVGVRLRSAINEALGVLADIRKAAA